MIQIPQLQKLKETPILDNTPYGAQDRMTQLPDPSLVYYPGVRGITGL